MGGFKQLLENCDKTLIEHIDKGLKQRIGCVSLVHSQALMIKILRYKYYNKRIAVKMVMFSLMTKKKVNCTIQQSQTWASIHLQMTK